jgi:hypothetical protein
MQRCPWCAYGPSSRVDEHVMISRAGWQLVCTPVLVVLPSQYTCLCVTSQDGGEPERLRLAEELKSLEEAVDDK